MLRLIFSGILLASAHEFVKQVDIEDHPLDLVNSFARLPIIRAFSNTVPSNFADSVNSYSTAVGIGLSIPFDTFAGVNVRDLIKKYRTRYI